MASGSTEIALASASKAAATVAVHRVRIVLSTSKTGPVKLTPGARAVRQSRSLARTAEAASTAGGGPADRYRVDQREPANRRNVFVHERTSVG
jgi:hypothetical protein